MATAAVGFGSADYARGLSVFTGGLIPAVKATWPDYTIEQLIRLNDSGFSSTANSRTIVSKDGSVMFVTFTPSQPLGGDWCEKGNSSKSGGKDTAEQATTAKTAPNSTKKDKCSYGRLDAAHLRDLKKRIYVVVAGTHFVTDEQLAASVESVDWSAYLG